MDFLARVAEKIAKVELDLGSANEIIAPDIQRQLAGSTLKPASSDQIRKGDKAVNEMMQGERELNAQLTALETQLDSDRESLHLRPMNLHRVVETALDLDLQPALIEVGSEDTDAAGLRAADARALAGSRSPAASPAASSRIACDRSRSTRPPPATTPAWSTPTSATRCCSARPGCSAPPCGAATPTSTGSARSSCPGCEESFAAAVARLVLVGRGGIRLHEEVFLAGTRLARRQAVGVERAEELLERALDGDRLVPAPEHMLAELVEAWNADDEHGVRARVQAAISSRVERRTTRGRSSSSDARREADLARVDAIFGRFEGTLRDSIAEAAARSRANPRACSSTSSSASRERDLRQMRRRLDDLDDERKREMEAVGERYADVKAWPFPAAVLFAISDGRRGAEEW